MSTQEEVFGGLLPQREEILCSGKKWQVPCRGRTDSSLDFPLKKRDCAEMLVQKQDVLLASFLLKRQGVYTELQLGETAQLFASARQGNLCMQRESMDSPLNTLSPQILGQDGNTATPIIRDGNRYYLQKNWAYETSLLQQVRRLKTNPIPSYIDKGAFSAFLSDLLNRNLLLPGQAKAIQSLLESSLTCICGGPGTGKTYTAGRLIQIFFSSRKKEEKPKLRICLAAPTGKAAYHLRASLEAQGFLDPALHIEASTLHRLLKIHPGSEELSKRRIDADLVVVDEASMIDVSLLAHLFSQIGDNTPLVLIGDPHQLPPVDAGGIFSEIGTLLGIHLDRCMRTDNQSLQNLADALKTANIEAFRKQIGSFLLPWSFNSKLSSQLYDWIDPWISSKQPDPELMMQKYGQRRLLNAIRQGPYGADALNRTIFSMMQSRMQKQWWAVPILAISNDSHAQLYNGMGGVLIGKGLENPEAYFPDFSSGSMKRFRTLPPHEIAFCLSIHKSQGSEFQNVLALFPEGSEGFGKESLYTAITRAKLDFQLIGAEKTLCMMAANATNRLSGFSARYIGSFAYSHLNSN